MRRVPIITGVCVTLACGILIAAAVCGNLYSDPLDRAWWDLAVLREPGYHLAERILAIGSRLDTSGGQNPLLSGARYWITCFVVASVGLGAVTWLSGHFFVRAIMKRREAPNNKGTEQATAQNPANR